MDGNSAIFNTTVWEVPSDMLTFAQDLNEVMEQDLQLFWERAFQAEREKSRCKGPWAGGK